MEKRLDKLPQRKEKIQLSCSWGFTNLLDFKNGGRNQKLLTNGKPKRKIVADAGDQRNNFSFDVQVQNLFRQETITENSAKKCTNSDMEQKRSSGFRLFKQLQINDKKAINYSKKTHQKTMRRLESELFQGHQESLSSTVTSSGNHFMDEMLEEVCHQIYRENSGEDLQRNVVPLKHDQLDHVKTQLLQTKAKAFIDQIYINRKSNRKSCADSESEQFLEAAEILKLNMDVFLKLLQRDQERTRLCLENNSSECQTSNECDYQDPESTTRTKKKDANNSLTKAKHGNGCSPKGYASSMASKRIVILKPESKVKQSTENVSCHCSSLQSHYILKNKGQIKGATFLALEDIKRKFRQAVGTNQKKQKSFLDRNLNVSVHQKHSLEEGKKRILFPDAKRREEQHVPVDLALRNELPVDSFAETLDRKINTSEQQKLDLFLEAKRHLSERFKTVDSGERLASKEAPRTLKMILSSRDLEMTMAGSSRNEALKSVSFPRSPKETNEVSSCSDEKKQEFEFRSNILDNLNAGTLELDNISSIPDDPQPSDETTESHEDSGCMERLEPGHANNFSRGNLLDSSPLDICKLQILENIEEKDEYRSPVSVLEPFRFEEGDSPPSTIPGPAESKLQPRCLNFEDVSFVPSSRDHQIEERTCINEEEDCLSLYVRAVIQVSGLSFDEFSSEGTLLPDVLHSYIDDEVRPIASEVDCDIKLFLDCVHEVIVGVYRCHFGCSPWTSSLLRRKISQVPLKEDFIDEVLKEVNCYVRPKNRQPTLDQLVKKDIASSSSWLDLQTDTEDILNRLAEDVLHDSILDTILDAKI